MINGFVLIHDDACLNTSGGTQFHHVCEHFQWDILGISNSTSFAPNTEQSVQVRDHL